tara:strand:- start:11251 stop:11616 length:366 start_codon:yes stop_codon:yes gene_type:complete
MSRVKRGVVANRKHKEVLKKAKGYYGARSKVYRVAKQAVIKAATYAYRDRRNRKRDFRSLWIVRIGAAAKYFGLSYSRLIHGLTQCDMQINRKMLAELAVYDIETFGAICQQVKKASATNA